jgi:hypothetical protein
MRAGRISRTVRLGLAAASATLATTAGVVTSAATAASADTQVGSCPAGFQLLSVVALTAEGYHLPALIDNPDLVLGNPHSNAWLQQPGNNDGWVCALPEGNRTTSFGGQLYLFVDDQLPASP